MIDIQTYRARIDGAPGIIDRILRRKATRFKFCGNMADDEEENLIRKFFKTMSIFHISYCFLVLLVMAFNVAKYSLCLQSTLHIDYSQFKESSYFYGTSGAISIAFKTVIESTLTISCIGLCLSSIGAVHFVSILLLMAGIEPNPGPKEKDHQTSSESNSDKFFLLNGTQIIL